MRSQPVDANVFTHIVNVTDRIPDSKSKQKIVSCPQCGAGVVWDASNRSRPFCSERCKMIDLGAWATESYRVPVEDDKDALDSDEPRGDQRQ